MLLPEATAAAPLLLLLAVAAHAANIPPAAAEQPLQLATVAAAAAAPIPTTAAEVAAAAAALNKEPGSVDAPVDGLDGKPHDGPGLRETRVKGTGKVGISGGSLHVDIKNPPPHTGDHEIVDVITPKEGDESTVCTILAPKGVGVWLD